ncbi:armadillo-type protein [Mycena leptocephala]|nr:armadillo-type protein [Mycena leptocephala]
MALGMCRMWNLRQAILVVALMPTSSSPWNLCQAILVVASTPTSSSPRPSSIAGLPGSLPSETRLLIAQIHSIIVALSPHVLTLIKDLNHVIHKCLNKLAPEDNHLIYNAVATNSIVLRLRPTVTAAASFSTASTVHLIISASNLTGIETTSNVIEKCMRAAEHSTLKTLIVELLSRTRLEKLLSDSYGNYCVQTVLDYAEPNQRALLMQGIWPVLPLIWKPPYGTRIYKKLQRDQIDQFGSGGYQHCESLVNIRGSRPGH